MTWDEAKRLRQIRQRAERKATPRPGDAELKYARNKKRWQTRKLDKAYRAARANGIKLKRWALFGGTLDLWNYYWDLQEGLCAICDRDLEFTKACFDHCHVNLKPRGILCNSCNLRLGWLETKFDRITEYLEGGSENVYNS